MADHKNGLVELQTLPPPGPQNLPAFLPLFSSERADLPSAGSGIDPAEEVFERMQGYLIRKLSKVTDPPGVRYALTKIAADPEFEAILCKLPSREGAPLSEPKLSGAPILGLSAELSTRVRQGLRAWWLYQRLAPVLQEVLVSRYPVLEASIPESREAAIDGIFGFLADSDRHPVIKRVLLGWCLAFPASLAVTTIPRFHYPPSVAEELIERFASGCEGMLRYACGIARENAVPFPEDVEPLDLAALRADMAEVVAERRRSREEAKESGLSVYPPLTD